MKILKEFWNFIKTEYYFATHKTVLSSQVQRYNIGDTIYLGGKVGRLNKGKPAKVVAIKYNENLIAVKEK